MKPYGQKRVYGKGLTRVVSAYAGKSRKIVTFVKNRKYGRKFEIEIEN
jgi:hypothetical protein